MENIFELIKQDWKGNEPIQIACTRICNYLFSRNGHPDFYTFDDLREIVNQDGEHIDEAAMYLSTPRLKILQLNLMYERGNYILDLPKEEVLNYSINEPVINPDTGEIMSDEEILICFLPGLFLKKD